MTFYLGTDEPSWLGRTSVPLMVSARRLRRLRRTLPAALGPWILDSGAFSEIAMFGRFVTSPGKYALEAARWSVEIGDLQWASPQDWMCEPDMLERTGLTVREHQRRTVENYLRLRLGHPPHFIPVLQGQTVDDYFRCADLYAAAGIALDREPVVGVGSVCRRHSSPETATLLSRLSSLGLRLHAFGLKTGGWALCAGSLSSADSMAWSYVARRRRIRLPSCEHRARVCNHCLDWALQWRERHVQASLA